MRKILVYFLLITMVLFCISCQKKEAVVEFAEKFIDISKSGNIEEMYELYYDDMLNQTYERVKHNLTKEQFDSMIKEEMISITDYELIEYGSEEMPATVPALDYVDYLYYINTGSETSLTEEMVTSCAKLCVDTQNGYSEHIIAEINGEWYLIF